MLGLLASVALALAPGSCGRDFGRLTDVDHPSSADIHYEYGTPGAKENAAGRVVKVMDEAGSETRGYDRLGNLARTTRMVVGLKPGAKANEYTTLFDFDPFGRMRSVTYPDGETVTYAYDAGGLLKSARGKKWRRSSDSAGLRSRGRRLTPERDRPNSIVASAIALPRFRRTRGSGIHLRA